MSGGTLGGEAYKDCFDLPVLVLRLTQYGHSCGADVIRAYM